MTEFHFVDGYIDKPVDSLNEWNDDQDEVVETSIRLEDAFLLSINPELLDENRVLIDE